MGVLALNAGSSSVKFAVFEGNDAVLRGQLSGIGGTPEITAHKRGQALPPPKLAGASQDDLLPGLMDWLDEHATVDAAGHRVVHGGMQFGAPVLVNADVLAGMEALVPLAPLHQPHSLAGVRAVAKARPGLPQVACFDTAFHRTMPDAATRLPIPRALHESGVRRYGFHGLSYEWIAGRLAELDPGLAAGRTIVAHLGSGASLCALEGGRSQATTMGFTALDGLMMGTRPGSLDPGIVLFLLQDRGMTADAVEDLLYHGCGLKGVSGIGSDMRELAASPAPAARQALDLFTHRLLAEIGSLAATMGGLDGLVFTAGIGAHDSGLRATCCARLAWLGVQIDAGRNEAGQAARLITGEGSPVRAWVIPTNEEAVIARHTRQVLSARLAGGGTPVQAGA